MAVTAPGTHNPADNTDIPTAWGDAVNSDLTDLDANSIRILNRAYTDNTIVNTVSETSLYSYSIPANTMGTTRAVNMKIWGDYLNSSGVGRTFTLKIKFGATTVYEDATLSLTTTATRRAFLFDIYCANQNATNAQEFGGLITVSSGGAVTTGVGDIATVEAFNVPIIGANSSIDTTAAATLDVTITHSNANANIEIRRLMGLVVLV